MYRRTILTSALVLVAYVEVSSIHYPLHIKESCNAQMSQDSNNSIGNGLEEVSLYKVWTLKYVNELHPIFKGMNTGSFVGAWKEADFTTPDTVRVVTMEGEECSNPYKLVNNEIVYPLSVKELKQREKVGWISLRISKLTANELRITTNIKEGKKNKGLEGDFVEWVFEAIQ